MPATRSRAATVPLVAGLPVLDLVNTVSWRGAPQRSEDHLQDPADCLVWASRVDTISTAEATVLRTRIEAQPSAGRLITEGLRRLRTIVPEVALNPCAQSLASAQAVIVDALQHSVLTPTPTPHAHSDTRAFRWSVPQLDEHTISRRLSLQLHTLLTQPTGRIGTCADPDCQWIFLDTSRGQARQWCDSRDCGNRYRVRQHQRRTHSETSA